MAKVKNKIVAGKYEGHNLAKDSGKIFFVVYPGDMIYIDDKTVKSYELVTEETWKSAKSGVARGLVGGALLGPVGLLAGLSAKNAGEFHLAVEWVKGGSSLITLNEKFYKLFTQSTFRSSQPQPLTQSAQQPTPQQVKGLNPDGTLDSLEEMKMYKELLDLNIISQAEFDLKKKEILGL